MVTCTLLFDMPGCIIDMLEPVFKIRLLDILFISSNIVGVPCSNSMRNVSFLTAFLGALRRKELPFFTPLSRLFTRGFFHSLLVLSVDFSPEERERLNVYSGSFF